MEIVLLKLSSIHETATTGPPGVADKDVARMRHLVARLSVLLVIVAWSGSAFAQQPSPGRVSTARRCGRGAVAVAPGAGVLIES
jgi:hypothetical protein